MVSFQNIQTNLRDNRFGLILFGSDLQLSPRLSGGQFKNGHPMIISQDWKGSQSIADLYPWTHKYNLSSVAPSLQSLKYLHSFKQNVTKILFYGHTHARSFSSITYFFAKLFHLSFKIQSLQKIEWCQQYETWEKVKVEEAILSEVAEGLLWYLISSKF